MHLLCKRGHLREIAKKEVYRLGGFSMMNNIGYKAYVQERFSLNKTRMEITEGGEKNE